MRLILSWDVSLYKMNYNASELFRNAARRARHLPAILVSDRLRVFGKAFRKIFYRRKSPQPVHFAESHIKNERSNNNAHERLNGIIADHLPIRGLQRMDSTHVRSLLIHYNFIRPHAGLGGITPARAAGINVSGSCSWRVLIQNAALAAT